MTRTGTTAGTTTVRILGIHCDTPHDAGVAVCEDGRISFALGEERQAFGDARVAIVGS